MTQKRTVLNIKESKTGNLGYQTSKPFKPTLRQAYYVDFEVASTLRGELISQRNLDFYLASDCIDSIRLLPFSTYQSICERLVTYPFRCRPVYNEGVWGGYYFKRIRNLPDTMKNCAWVFDLIPLEVSIVVKTGQLEIEFPFFGFVQTIGEKLMGAACVKKFDGYFPIRFNYDDTFHASGNMSIQCHPDSEYVKKQNNELGRQDESYYIVAAGQEAKTYCGFNQDCDVEAFIARCKTAERTMEPFDHDAYVYAEPSRPGMQFLIPAGTIHASGRNQVILEIGSLTVGSYTYKMYDYARKDFDGKPRPIHAIHGDAVLKRERKEGWVHENLIQQPRLVRQSAEGKEIIVGEHDLIYFSLRNLLFNKRYTDETTDRFQVLVLVEGEKVLVRSLSDPSRFFIQEYLDMVVVPASFGKYELINLGVGSIVMHKTMLRDGYEQIDR
jgi:mannose-6-phosphate isomerase class I